MGLREPQNKIYGLSHDGFDIKLTDTRLPYLTLTYNAGSKIAYLQVGSTTYVTADAPEPQPTSDENRYVGEHLENLLVADENSQPINDIIAAMRTIIDIPLANPDLQRSI